MKPLKIRHKITNMPYKLLDTVPGGYNFLSKKGKEHFISKPELLTTYRVIKWEEAPPVYLKGETIEEFIERAVE